MSADFEVAACHGDHAGKAHVSLRCLVGGGEIAIQHVPFDATEDESLIEEQARILAEAARLAGAAAAFLHEEAKLKRGWPTRSPPPDGSPGAVDAPNVTPRG